MVKTPVLISALAGLALAAWTPFTFVPKPSPTQEKVQVSDVEIKKLIKNLGDADFRVREKATKQLTEIGLPALDALFDAEQSSDPEIKNRASKVIRNIQVAHRLPVRVKGMEFKLIVDSEWKIPLAGEDSTVTFFLEITNVSKVSQGFSELPIVEVVVADAPNKITRIGPGTRGTVPLNDTYHYLEPNQTLKLSFHGKLFHRKDQIQLVCSDRFTNYWEFRGLSKGALTISLIYENKVGFTKSGAALWMGRAETVGERVTTK